jgi:hypothetical protein
MAIGTGIELPAKFDPPQGKSSAATPRAFSWLPARSLRLAPRWRVHLVQRLKQIKEPTLLYNQAELDQRFERKD